MIRWKYVIPRLMIGLLLFAMVYFGTNPFLRWVIISSAQSATGAKVELDSVNLDYASGKIALTEIHMASPRNAMENMFQAELAELDLDSQMLLKKKLVIENATLNNIQFSTPRTKSGALAQHEGESIVDFNWATGQVKEQIESLGKDWLRELENKTINTIENNFETIAVIKRLDKEWTQRYANQKARTRSIQNRIANLKKLIEQPHKNPLREIDRYQNALSEIQALNREAELAKREIRLMNEQFAKDQLAIKTAKANDKRKIQNAAEYLTIDAESTSDLLLGEEKSRYVREALQWVNWFRNTVPDPQRDFYPARGRGRDIVFDGLKIQPGFLVRNAHLSGKGVIGGNRYHFTGTANDLTNRPDLHGSPAKFSLHADGNRRLEVDAIVDRRGDKKIDQMRISLPSVDVPGKVLGSDKSLLVNVSPGKLDAEIQIQLVDDQLTGKMVIKHDNVRMDLQHLHSSLGGTQLTQTVNSQLKTIDQFKIELDLSGTVDDMTVRMKSDLGNQVSSVFGQVANSAIRHNMDSAKQKFDQMVDTEIQKLTTNHSNEVQSLLNLINGDVRHVANLKQLMSNGNNGRRFR